MPRDMCQGSCQRLGEIVPDMLRPEVSQSADGPAAAAGRNPLTPSPAQERRLERAPSTRPQLHAHARELHGQVLALARRRLVHRLRKLRVAGAFSAVQTSDTAAIPCRRATVSQ